MADEVVQLFIPMVASVTLFTLIGWIVFFRRGCWLQPAPQEPAEAGSHDC
jgi:hypothetical protein